MSLLSHSSCCGAPWRGVVVDTTGIAVLALCGWATGVVAVRGEWSWVAWWVAAGVLLVREDTHVLICQQRFGVGWTNLWCAARAGLPGVGLGHPGGCECPGQRGLGGCS